MMIAFNVGIKKPGNKIATTEPMPQEMTPAQLIPGMLLHFFGSPFRRIK